MKEIYLDYSSATPLDQRVKAAMEPYWSEEYGNPSAIHAKGRAARKAVEEARKTVAAVLHCRAGEIIFTAGATEADNLAILGAAGAFDDKRGHFITSALEHHAVLKSFNALERRGHSVTILGVSADGIIDPRALEEAIRPETVLISIGYANNEIGAIQPIAEIGKVIKNWRRQQAENSPSHFPLLHSDASPAAGFLDLNVDRLGVDLMTLNSAKIYGPKGVGALFVRRNIELAPVTYGGGQEKNIRSGTENVPGIAGLAKALEIAEKERVKESARLVKLRDYFAARLLKDIPGVLLNGSPADRLPNNVNVSIPGIEGEAAVMYLDAKGVYAATGAACASESVDPSHVLLAIGRNREEALGSIRFSLGRETSREDLDYAADSLLSILPL
ncbi:MAG: cysteine desulfurase, partial [Candidatus Sungbacteria bacterium]|nr:cysteine desulfurase [Candidatus Sungbacteria bacterium]